MKPLHLVSTCALLGAAALTACTLGGSLDYKDGELNTEYHYKLRLDELVEETFDYLNELTAKLLGELNLATFENAGPVTVEVMDKLPQDADVVFVIDNTGSMYWAIDSIRDSVVEAMKKTPDRRYGVVTYRDRGDSYISKVQAPLSSDIEAAIAGVNAMKAGGGGDFPEFVAAGLDDALNQPWRMDKERFIILIGDAPDKGYKDTPITMDSVSEKAKMLGVTIHGVGLPCGDVCKEEIGAK